MTTPRDLVLEQIHHRQTNPVPYYLDMEPEVADRLDAHFGSDSWRERLVPYLTITRGLETAPVEKLPDLRERDIFGAIWRLDMRPMHIEKPAMSEPSFEHYQFPHISQFDNSAKKAAARAKFEAAQDSFRIAEVAWGLFERTWIMRGFENSLMDAIAEEEFYTELLDRLMDLYTVFVKETCELPCDAVFFADDWGDQRGVMIGAERWRKFLKPRWAKLYQIVHDSGKIVISHCCGNIQEIIPDCIEIGLDVLQCIQPEAMDPYNLKQRWGDKIAFWGGLGSQKTMPFGTPQQVRTEVKNLIEGMGRGGGYILGPSKLLQPETPTENAVAALEAFTQQS